MICTSRNPDASSPSRMAATRPSIMSEGAMMSQPASACTSACRTHTATVSSLRIRPASIDHGGGRDDLAPGSALTQRLPHQPRDRLVVEDPAVLDQAVMAVAGVGIERHVAEHAEIGKFLLDGPHGLAD